MNEEIKEITQVHVDYDRQLWIFYIDKNGKRYEYVDIDEESLTDYITNLQEENRKLNKIIDELEKFCNEEIKEWYKADFGEEIIDNSFRQTLMTYEFILKKLTELKNEVE